jgi:RimJ/RimL family protein N-acetyltransferase/protein tyrosine phosphatase (PTP) superfamily phosphohydrolase (DUF442 family)
MIPLERLESIRDFRPISDRLLTAGQPREDQFADIAGAGCTTVVNLALPTSPDAIADESTIVAQQGMTYVSIPIDFERPDIESAVRYLEVLRSRSAERLFVHCVANKRVSALTYVYRVAVAQHDSAAARRDLDALWQPNPTWRRLMSELGRRSLGRPQRLETERLVLRDFVESDVESVHAYGTEPEVYQYMIWGPNTLEQTRGFIEQELMHQTEPDRRAYEFAIVQRSDDQLVGGVGLRVRSAEHLEADIGYVLARLAWGNGYATEAARRVIAFGFDVLGMHRIYATADVRNLASQHVLEKLGMRREGTLRQNQCIRDTWRDTAMYAVLEDEWRRGG